MAACLSEDPKIFVYGGPRLESSTVAARSSYPRRARRKERTVPVIYPLSPNALTAGCNQRNNRDPVLNASGIDVQAAIDRLKPLSLVIESSGSRVMRYSQNVGRMLKVPSEAVALLAALWLRGPQTVAELRATTERLHRFADVGSVEGFLQQLAERSSESGGPLVRLLPRGAGSRESRWLDLISPAAEAVNAESRGEQEIGIAPAPECARGWSTCAPNCRRCASGCGSWKITVRWAERGRQHARPVTGCSSAFGPEADIREPQPCSDIYHQSRRFPALRHVAHTARRLAKRRMRRVTAHEAPR